MANSNLQVLQRQLATAYQLIQQNKAEQAIPKLEAIIDEFPDSADAIHLAGLAYKSLGRAPEAAASFQKSLALNHQQPQVHNNLANLYKSGEQYQAAEKHYRQAISLQPDFSDAQRNLAICLAAEQRFGEAQTLFETVLERNPDDVSAHCGLADSFRHAGDLAEAVKHYRRAIELVPNYLNAWHNLGVALHLDGALDEALQCYQHAYQMAPQQVEVIQSLANAMHESGETQAALNLLRSSLRDSPQAVLLHERFNELLWELDLTSEFCQSYERAIQRAPENLPLNVARCRQLFRAGQLERAENAVNDALEVFSETPDLLALHGQIQAELGYPDVASEALSRSLELEFDKETAQALTKLHIIERRYPKAQLVLDAAMRSDPDCQLNWALQSLIWRLTNDGRYGWLNDYQRFVRAFMLPTPPGYATLADFLAALTEVLLGLHRTENAPLQQTLRNGTQTAARLLHQPIKELQDLKASLTQVVASYIAELPDDSSHPLLSRKSEHFEFSGSWSVKLKPDGFHVNHVHPAGWISSSCYVHIPDSMHREDAGREGMIKFGESPLALGDLEVIEKLVKPEEGTVVLFPSYMWHGTFPFSGAEGEFRMTSPFDVVPVS